MTKPVYPETKGLNLRGIDLVRLSRMADDLDLSTPTRHSLRHAVLDGLDTAFTDVRRRGTLNVDTKPVSVNKDRYSSWTVEKLEYHIRRAVTADVSWDKIEPYAWKMFDIDSSAAMAGRIVELAYLQGGLAAAVGIMETLAKLNIRYFQHIHERLKIPLIINLWCRSEVTLLADLLKDASNQAGMSSLEKYFCFWQSLHGSDPGRPVMYYQKNKLTLHAAAIEYGDKVGFSKDKFLLVLGRLHLELGMEENARIVLEQISSQSKEYADALDILLKLKIIKNRNGHSVYAAKLNAETEWQKRIFLLNTFFSQCRRLGSFRDKNRPALNEILSDPLKWFPKTVEAWSALSSALIENIDLEGILPELTRVFRENSFVMHSPELDRALWSGVIMHTKGRSPCQRYFLGMAKLHYFIASASPTCEIALWEAKNLIDSVYKEQSYPFAKDWQESHRFAYQYISKSIYHTETNREHNLRQLKVATDARLLAMSDITRYLEESRYPSTEVLTNLQYIVRARKQYDVEIEVILKRASLTHLTNRDIENVWRLANLQNDWDLAWRAISLLKQRKNINNSIVQAWQISGEKRSFYPLINVSVRHVMGFIRDFKPEQQKLIKSILTVGPNIAELLYILDSGAKTSKIRQFRSDSVEAKAAKFLNGLSWLPAQKKLYQFSLDGVRASHNNLPLFTGAMPSNQWTFIFQEISSRLGITSWNWSLSRLHGQIEDLIPRLVNRQDLLKSSTRVAKWIRMLTAEQRSAWTDLAKLSANMDDDEAASTLYRFVIRASTLICVNHTEALGSIYTMKLPVELIWDFERWVVGSQYSGHRTALDLYSKVPVPRSLRNVDLL